MSDCTQIVNANTSNISHETEDGEIEDLHSNTQEICAQDKEIEEYYKKLKHISVALRCSCCGEVYSDPVRLKCDHLIDRCCISNKIKSNIIICPLCQKHTYCDDIDDLLTDFDIAAQIPPKPNALIEIINKQGSNNPKRLKLDSNKEPEKNDLSDDQEYDIINGERVKKEKIQKRRRKTRWSAIDESKINVSDISNTPDPQATFTGVISDILASHNVPKNITISQFKKYTELSSKADIMNFLTEVVIQNTKEDSNHNEKRSHSLSDKDILEMIPLHELEDLFDLEKIQLILLYREALDKGVLVLPSQRKPVTQSTTSKQALLPTPKTSSNGSVESHGKSSPTSPRKRYTSESSKSSNISRRSSVKSLLDLSDNESCGDTRKRGHKKHKRRKSSPVPKPVTVSVTKSITKPIAEASQISNEALPKLPTAIISSDPPSTSEIKAPSPTDCNKSVAAPVQTSTVAVTSDCQKQICDNIRYREDINRLHALYSTMYHASLKMKDCEHNVNGAEYKNSYRTYCDNYSEYQHLYSSLQSVINIDAISADNPGSISNNSPNTTGAVTIGNPPSSVEVSQVIGGSSSQEQLSTTMPIVSDVPDSIDSTGDSQNNHDQLQKQAPQPTPINNQHIRAEIKANIQNNLTNYRQFKKDNSLESNKKFGYLWISNLSADVRTSDLCKVFGKYGHISKVKLFQYKAQVPPTYFGLVFMPNYGEAETAVRQLQNKLVHDKQMQIKMLCPNSESILNKSSSATI